MEEYVDGDSRIWKKMVKIERSLKIIGKGASMCDQRPMI